MPLPFPWLERSFPFEFPPELYPDLIERLRGAPLRLGERVSGLTREQLTSIPDDGDWSIQDNVGHMIDLESLPSRRAEQILAGERELVAWDTTNSATYDAAHNERDIQELLVAFAAARDALVTRMEGVDPARFGDSALHPRLGKPMRLVDILEFQAQHDDYHIARISQLRRRFA